MTTTASAWERQKAREIAEAVLEGRLSVLEGARALCRFARSTAIPMEDDRTLVIAIDSETDDLPNGEVRKHWAADALREKDVEIARAEGLWKNQFLDACRRILQN
jgi:hypothetical protein